MPRDLGLTDAMDRLMRGFAGGGAAVNQGIGNVANVLLSQRMQQKQMDAETERAQAALAQKQQEALEQRKWDEEKLRRGQEFDAAKEGLRPRMVTQPRAGEMEKASSDVSQRIEQNPVTRLFDSGLAGIPGVPAGIMTAMEGGSVLNDPKNQGRLFEQVQQGWERDPAWVDPRAKPAPPPQTALDPKRAQWFDTEARQRVIKPPALTQIEQLLALVNDPNTPPDRQLAAQEQLRQVNDERWQQMNEQYEGAVLKAKLRLMSEQLASGAPDSPFLEQAIRGLQSAYGPRPWQPGDGDLSQPEPFTPPMAGGDASDIDVDDENVPLEQREQALRQAVAADEAAAPPAPQASQPAGAPQSTPWTGPVPSRVFAKPPLTGQESLGRAVGEAEMQAAEQGLTIDDILAQEDPTWPAEVERMETSANVDLVDPFSQPPPPPPPHEGAGVPAPFTENGQWPEKEPIDESALEGRPAAPSAVEYSGAGGVSNLMDQALAEVANTLGLQAGQGEQGLTDLLTGGAQSQAWAGPANGQPVQPSVGLEASGMSQEVPLVNVAPGIDLAEPAAASFAELMSDPNMTPEMQQIMLRPGQGQVSAFRTYETQQDMRDRWDRGEAPDDWLVRPGAPGAAAGKHTSGTALDLGQVPPDLADLLMRYGWRPTSGDYTHWRFMGGP